MLIYLALTLLGIIVTCTALLVAVKLFYRPKYPNHPPFVGPDMWTNVALLTDSTSCSAVTHLLELHKSLNNFGKTTRGAVFQIYMMSKNFTIVSDYNLARLIFAGDISKGVKESEKTSIGRAFDMFPKYGSIFSSLTSDQQRHKTRKFLAPCFSMSNLKYTFEVILNSLVTCQQKLSAYAKDGTEFDLNDVMITLTFDVITESSFGVNWNTQKDDIVSDGTVFLYESEVRLREGFRRTLNPLRKITFWTNDYQRRELAVQRLSTILRKVLSDYRSRTNDIEADHSIMGHLMNNAYENDDARITDMSTFLTAGHETTSHSLTMMLVALARHPTVLRKLQSELDASIPSSARLDINQFPSSATIRSLPYLSGCINEAMRLFPVGGAGSKRITVSEIEYEGVVIPKGSTCVLAVHSMYRQPWIERVDEFLPERWETSNPQEKELRAMFMPFAHGGRNCIGQNLAKVELWLISAYLLRFFEFELLSEPSYQIFLTMKATNVRVKVHSRQ